MGVKKFEKFSLGLGYLNGFSKFKAGGDADGSRLSVYSGYVTTKFLSWLRMGVSSQWYLEEEYHDVIDSSDLQLGYARWALGLGLTVGEFDIEGGHRFTSRAHNVTTKVVETPTSTLSTSSEQGIYLPPETFVRLTHRLDETWRLFTLAQFFDYDIKARDSWYGNETLTLERTVMLALGVSYSSGSLGVEGMLLHLPLADSSLSRGRGLVTTNGAEVNASYKLADNLSFGGQLAAGYGQESWKISNGTSLKIKKDYLNTALWVNAAF